MVDIATISAGIAAASAAVKLFDGIADQVERFITKSETPSVPKEHRMKIEGDADAIVVRSEGREVQRITAGDLNALPEAQLRHVKVLEKSMENHYSIWEKVYPQLALAVDPIQEAKIDQQLKQIIRTMKKDLGGILTFLESCGIQLDDHYLHIRQLVAEV